MKSVLPILLCYLLMTTQAFALSGGPVYGKGGISPVGTFSGLLQGVSDTDVSSGPSAGTVTPSNALGLFDLSVPQTGLATGDFLLFANGFVYTGTIDASVDFDSDKMAGVVFASSYQIEFVDSASDGSFVSESVLVAQANGRVDGRVRSSAQTAISTARVIGTATLNIAYLDGSGLVPPVSDSLSCTVNGFRQSFVAASSSTSTGTGLGGFTGG